MKGIKAIEGLSFALKDKWQDKVICKSENEKHTIAELLEIVYKDLEVLEIIKSSITNKEEHKYVLNEKMKGQKFMTMSFTVKGTDKFNKVKEWLDNDSNQRND